VTRALPTRSLSESSEGASRLRATPTMRRMTEFERLAPHLDPGIAAMMRVLMENDVETLESCQRGLGHANPEPTVRVFGQRAEGFKAFAIAMDHGLQVLHLRRVWPIVGGEPTGPWWEMVFHAPTTES
jgi:hypothetical protein